MLNKKLIIIFLSILLIVLIIANVKHFLNREWESSFYPSNYATLYYPTDIPTIVEWNRISLYEIQVKIKWVQDVKEWRILCEGQEPQIGHGMNPTFKLVNEECTQHEYTFTPLPDGSGPDVKFKISVYPEQFYAERGMKRNDAYIIKTNMPRGDFKQYPVSYWVDSYDYVGEKDLQEADRIIREEIGIQENEPAFRKMEKLTSYLRKKLINARGVPKDDLRWMNPFLIFKEMVAGIAKGWCTQHGQIWVFFANRAGIPTRLMLGAVTQDNKFVYTGHTWAESYIKEQNRWAFVDLAHSQIYITDKLGQVLNTAELLHLNQHNAFDSTYARIYQDWEWNKLPIETTEDSIVTVPYSFSNSTIRGEFSSLAIIKYRRPPNVEDVRDIYAGFLKDKTFLWGNLERYLFKPPLTYSFYPTEGKHTYFIRWLLFYSMCFVFVLLVISILVPKRKTF